MHVDGVISLDVRQRVKSETVKGGILGSLHTGMLNVSGLEGGDGSEGLFDGLQESVATPFIGVLVHRLPDAAGYPYDERFGYRPQ